MGTEAYPATNASDDLENSSQVAKAFRDAAGELTLIGCQSCQAFGEGVLETPHLLFRLARQLGEYSGGEGPPCFWPPEKVARIYNGLECAEERLRLVQKLKAEPGIMYDNLRFLEETRLFLRVCVEHGLGVWLN